MKMNIIGNLIIGKVVHSVLKKIVPEKKATGIVIGAAVVTIAVPQVSRYVKKKKETSTHTMTVVSQKWERNIRIQEFKTETKTGWELENGAYDVQVTQKLRTFKNSAEFSSSFGDITIPITKYDTYYIYKIGDWTKSTYKQVCGNGDYDHQKFISEFDSVEVTYEVNKKPDRKPHDGDTRKLANDISYSLTLMDTVTGEIRHQNVCADVYNAVRENDDILVDLDIFGAIKNIRKDVGKDAHIEIIEATAYEARETCNP
jgi:hypothetical protein